MGRTLGEVCLLRLQLIRITAAVTGPPPKNYDFKTRVIGGSRSPHGYQALVVSADLGKSWPNSRRFVVTK
jgi:hypothetical protein